MNPSSLDFALCKLMDLGGGKAAGSGTGNAGDIRLEMLKFTRQKTPDIGGENIVLIFHIRREGEEPAGGETAGGSGTAGTANPSCSAASEALRMRNGLSPSSERSSPSPNGTPSGGSSITASRRRADTGSRPSERQSPLWTRQSSSAKNRSSTKRLPGYPHTSS